MKINSDDLKVWCGECCSFTNVTVTKGDGLVCNICDETIAIIEEEDGG